MKTLTEIKNKTLKELHDEAMEKLFEQVVGKIFYCKQRDYAPVLIVAIKIELEYKSQIKVEFLHDEKTHAILYETWGEIARNFLTNSEYESQKEGIELLKKYHEGFAAIRKSTYNSNYSQVRPKIPRRPKGGLRYK